MDRALEGTGLLGSCQAQRLENRDSRGFVLFDSRFTFVYHPALFGGPRSVRMLTERMREGIDGAEKFS